jgi:hypothetical protein
MSRQIVQTQPPAAIPFAMIVERGLVAGVAALIVARPLVAGDDPGRLRLTSGNGPISFNFCVLLLLAIAAAWRWYHQPAGRRQLQLIPWLLAGVGLVAFASSRLGDRYARPGLFIGWEWIALAAIYYLVRRSAASSVDTRGLLHVLLATVVSVAGLGVYQSLTKPLGLPNTDVTIPGDPTALAGDDEFYPELNPRPSELKPARGTLDSPETLLVFVLLALPTAMVIARSGIRDRRGRWLRFVPALLIVGAVVALANQSFAGRSRSLSTAMDMLQHDLLLGVGPGNFVRLATGHTAANGAWFELAATTGLIGLIFFIAAVVVAMKTAWPTNAIETAVVPPTKPQWVFYLGGMVGLVLGFIWAFGDAPAEAPANEVFNLGTAAVLRAILWFATFSILEKARTASRTLAYSVLVGVGLVLVIGFVSDAPGRSTVLFPMVVLLALAANLTRPEVPGLVDISGKAMRVGELLLAVLLAAGYLITAGLPAWSTASAVREARMASRHVPEKHREYDRARPGHARATALTSARGFLLGNILNPLLDAVERDSNNAALWLEIARWQRKLWEYQLFADPENAARVADDTRKAAERAGQLDPHNLAAKRSLFEAFLLFRTNSSVRQPERIAALVKIIGQIAEREPTAEVPLRFRMVQMLLIREEKEGVDAEVGHLLRLNSVEGAPHGRLSNEQYQEIVERTLRRWFW